MNVPRVFLNLSTNFPTDLNKYSSSSTVPFLPDPAFLSSFLLLLELRFEIRETVDGATVYRVKAVGAMDTSVMTSTLANAGSSTPKNASRTVHTGASQTSELIFYLPTIDQAATKAPLW